MGGDFNPDAIMEARLNRAKMATSRQIEEAKKLHIHYFPSNDNPKLLAAIIQALATNYAAGVTSNGG